MSPKTFEAIWASENKRAASVMLKRRSEKFAPRRKLAGLKRKVLPPQCLCRIDGALSLVRPRATSAVNSRGAVVSADISMWSFINASLYRSGSHTNTACFYYTDKFEMSIKITPLTCLVIANDKQITLSYLVI